MTTSTSLRGIDTMADDLNLDMQPDIEVLEALDAAENELRKAAFVVTRKSGEIVAVQGPLTPDFARQVAYHVNEYPYGFGRWGSRGYATVENKCPEGWQ